MLSINEEGDFLEIDDPDNKCVNKKKGNDWAFRAKASMYNCCLILHIMILLAVAIWALIQG